MLCFLLFGLFVVILARKNVEKWGIFKYGMNLIKKLKAVLCTANRNTHTHTYRQHSLQFKGAFLSKVCIMLLFRVAINIQVSNIWQFHTLVFDLHVERKGL